MRTLARWLSRKSAVLFAVSLLGACGQAPPQIAELSGRTMGTSYGIKLSPAPDQSGLDLLQQAVEQRLQTVNRQMSTYLPDSDLMRFNRSSSTDWQAQPAPVVQLVERASRVSQLTGGRYDITVGPLVNLWGFGNNGERETPPSQRAIAATLARVGYSRLESRADPPALRKQHPQLEIDLSSIAKGWAVDEIARILVADGRDNFLVEIGGELRARGQKGPGRPWRIAIEQPLYDARAVQRVIPLRDIAMATSGDYRNFFSADDRLYSHTIDPETGSPVRHRLASVTVLAADCTEADAWATALLALGEERAPALADELGLLALFIIRTPQGLQEQASRALAESGLLDVASG